jgi:hypothetical protein
VAIEQGVAAGGVHPVLDGFCGAPGTIFHRRGAQRAPDSWEREERVTGSGRERPVVGRPEQGGERGSKSRPWPFAVCLLLCGRRGRSSKTKDNAMFINNKSY